MLLILLSRSSLINSDSNELMYTQVDRNRSAYSMFSDSKQLQNGIFMGVNELCLSIILGAVIRHCKRRRIFILYGFSTAIYGV